VSFLEIVGLIGDLLSLIGLGFGLPLYFVGALLHAADKKMIPTEVVTTGDANASPLLRWYASGDFYERPMRTIERDYFKEQEYRVGYVKPRHPETMRLEPQRQSTRIFRVLGTTLVVVGLVGLLASFLPLLSR
jgi:hypothetical protein